MFYFFGWFYFRFVRQSNSKFGIKRIDYSTISRLFILAYHLFFLARCQRFSRFLVRNFLFLNHHLATISVSAPRCSFNCHNDLRPKKVTIEKIDSNIDHKTTNCSLAQFVVRCLKIKACLELCSIEIFRCCHSCHYKYPINVRLLFN